MMDYSLNINKFLSRQTIIKCVSFNLENISELANDDTYKIYSDVSKTKYFENKMDVYNFLYNMLYIDITGVLDIKPLSFLLKTSYNLKDTIKSDTGKFNEIKKVGGQKYDSNLQYIYIKDWLNVVNAIVSDERAGNNMMVMDVLLKHHMGVYEKYLKVGNKLLGILENENNNDFQTRLNVLLSDKVKNNILTYIKIRNNGNIDYNRRRFGVKLNEKRRLLMVKYNEDNISYDNEKKPPVKYDNEYVFGPFTNIFIPCISNKTVANEMTDITNILDMGKNIFTFGYGASGAGKTSSLIYFNKGETPELKDGILIHICNIMNSKGYNKVEVKFKEFYKEKNEKSVTIIEQPKKSDNSSNLVFKNDGDGYKLSSDYDHVITHDYRVDGVLNNKFTKGTPLGELMYYLVDKDRYVKATTNNPNSSRSHVLVYVRFIGKNSPLLILGDFAGVENSFDCENEDILDKFTNVMMDNGNVPFYSKYKEKGVVRFEVPLPKLLENKVGEIESKGKMLPPMIFEFLDKLFVGDEMKFMKVLFEPVYNDYEKFVTKLNVFNEIVKKIKTPKITKQSIKELRDDSVGKNIYTKLDTTLDKNKTVSILEIINYIIKSNESKKTYAKDICNIRKGEGKMINESLKDVNDVIKMILKEKNKDAVDISPEFIEKCLPLYCKGDRCFSLEERGDKIASIIFDNIKSEFNNTPNYKDLKELIIGIFCVFNISIGANNPPPIPFVDINKQLQMINNITGSGDIELENMRKLRDYMYELKMKLEKYIDKIPELYNEISLFTELRKTKEGKYVKSSFEVYVNANFDPFIIKCREFLEKVEKSNAASAIGTLKTVDNLSKYNTVNTICNAALLGDDISAFKKNVECEK